MGDINEEDFYSGKCFEAPDLAPADDDVVDLDDVTMTCQEPVEVAGASEENSHTETTVKKEKKEKSAKPSNPGLYLLGFDCIKLMTKHSN